MGPCDGRAVDGFIPLGCDGTRLTCPRSAELGRRLGVRAKRSRGKKKGAPAGPAGQGGEQDAASSERTKGRRAGPTVPQIWVTAVVHLGLDVLWSWRLGRGIADER
jgi:hypothetical protein